MEVLRRIDLFKHLDNDRLALLASNAIYKKYTMGSILFFEGEKPRALIFLIAGKLKLYKIGPKGNEIVLHHFFPYQPVVETPLFEALSYPASSIFETDGEVLFLESTCFTDVLAQDPSLALAVIRSLSQKILYLNDFINMNIVHDSTARVAKYLLVHDGEFPRLKKSIIAQDLNIAPETFSRILKKFKDLQYIEEIDHQVIITNRQGLQLLYEV